MTKHEFKLLHYLGLIGLLLTLAPMTTYKSVAQSPLFILVGNDPNVLLKMSIETPIVGAA